MEEQILLLIFMPILFAMTLPISSIRVRNIATYTYVSFLIFLSVTHFFASEYTIEFTFSHTVHSIFIGIDCLLLLYFIYQGFKYKNKLVSSLAIGQTILFGYFLSLDIQQNSVDILVDKVSSFMLLVINIVGGIIIIYSLRYIQSEDKMQFQRNGFIVLLFFFIDFMNFFFITLK